MKNKLAKRIKKNKPFVFSQKIDPFRKEILVSVGAETKDILSYVNKYYIKQARKDFPVILEYYKDLFEKIKKGKGGYALHFHNDKSNNRYLILLLRPYEDIWDYWEILIHELSHILDWVVEDCMIEKETEARAYLHEFLFRSIRRKLQGLDNRAAE